MGYHFPTNEGGRHTGAGHRKLTGIKEVVHFFTSAGGLQDSGLA